MSIEPESPVESELDKFHREIRDAQMLLNYAVAAGKPIENRLVAAIKTAEQFLQESSLPDNEARTIFEQSYRDLAQALAPVSTKTLIATSDEYGRQIFPLAPRRPLCEAKLWSRKLWVMTGVIAVSILASENYLAILRTFFAQDEETAQADLVWHKFAVVLMSLIPFAYGGLGAATYLLRSAHEHLIARTFDPNHIPEYYNRLLLGLIAGGSIQLFVAQVPGEGTTTFKISAAALAFIAGYNSDFLFSAIDRVSAAILPKIGLDSVRRPDPPKITGLSLVELLDRLHNANSQEEKELIQGLINKIKERL
jgi:hypothetical protein